MWTSLQDQNELSSDKPVNISNTGNRLLTKLETFCLKVTVFFDQFE